MLFHFSLITSYSQGNILLVHCLVVMHSATAPLWAMTKISYSSLRYLLKSIKFYSYIYRIGIDFITFGKWRLIISKVSIVSCFCEDSRESLLKRFCDRKIFKTGVNLSVETVVYLLFRYEYRVTPQKKNKKKTAPIYFWLKFINSILAFSFFQDMKYEKLGP